MKKSNTSGGLDPYQALANAIVKTAADDYRTVMKRLAKNPENSIARSSAKDLRKFFRSQWYSVLTDIDGEYLLGMLDKEFPEVEFPEEE